MISVNADDDSGCTGQRTNTENCGLKRLLLCCFATCLCDIYTSLVGTVCGVMLFFAC